MVSRNLLTYYSISFLIIGIGGYVKDDCMTGIIGMIGFTSTMIYLSFTDKRIEKW